LHFKKIGIRLLRQNFQLFGKLENMASSSIPPPMGKAKIKPVRSLFFSCGVFSSPILEGGAVSVWLSTGAWLIARQLETYTLLQRFLI
jgi:hypothetical protein